MNQIKETIKKIVCDIIDIENVSVSDSLSDDLGYDSIDFMQLISRLSNEFNVNVNPQTWLNFIEEIKPHSDLNSISDWESKLLEYDINIDSDFIANLEFLKIKNDTDSIKARIISLININTLSMLIFKIKLP